MQSIISTKRLYLREFSTNDIVDLYELNSDPEVLKFTGDEPFHSKLEAEEFLNNYSAYKTTGLGRWAVINKEDHNFLGWCGLKYHPKDRVVDLGYRFKREFWGNGYATEAAQACIDYAFEVKRFSKLVAHAHINNKISHRVLEKLGFSFIKEFDYEGIDAKLYKLKNPHYLIKSISSKETWPVRHPILRKGRPLEDCRFENDDLNTTFHLGCFYKENLVGVATFLKNENPNFKGSQYQLRGMAVLEDYQKKRVGEMLINQAAKQLTDDGIQILWFNAREIALSFYKNLNFQIKGDPFDIKSIGTHYLMYKKLL